MVGVSWAREELHLRIEERCEAMLENGMIEETEALLSSMTDALSNTVQLGYYYCVINSASNTDTSIRHERDELRCSVAGWSARTRGC